jgi:Spy/CpxP family protein refolding chaperone
MISLAESGRTAGWRGRLVWLALILSLTLNVFFIGGVVWSRVEAGRFAETPEEHFHELGQQLDLNDAQQLAFENFLRTVRQNVRVVREKNVPLLRQVWQEETKATSDQASIEQLSEQVHENRVAFRKAAAAALAGFLTSLTPEQRAKFATLAERHHDPAARHIWYMIVP